MNYRENKNQQNLLNQFLAEHGVQLSEDVLGKLYDFADLVVNTKQFGNLISAKDSEKFLSRHIADSLVPYIYIVKGGLQDNSTPNSEFRNPNSNRNRSLDGRPRVVIHEFKVLELEFKKVLDFGIQLHARQIARRTRKLFLHLVKMVRINMRIT